MLKRSLIVLMALALVASLAVGCRPAGPDIGGVLVRAMIGNPSLFNPILSADTASSDIEGFIFQGLVRYDENMQRVGSLAHDWEISEDNLEWTFFLREGVTWQDGEPFTTADVEFTIGTTAFNEDYPGPRASMFDLLEEIVVVDDYTITFILSEPFGPFMNNIGFSIIPQHIYDPEVSEEYNVAIADMYEHPANLNPIGTGPYNYGEWVEGEYIDLVRNPDYWNSPEPYIETILFRFVEDLATAVASLEAGEIDLLAGIPDDDLLRVVLNLQDTHNFYEYQELVYDWIGFQFREEPFLDHFGFNPFHDLRVRQAFAHAVNRQAFLDDILQGRGTLMNSHIPPNSWAYSEDVHVYEYDPDIANDLLTEAGWIWRDGDDYRTWEDDESIVLHFDIYTNIGNNRREQITVLTQQDLAEVGVSLELQWIEWATLLNNYVFTAEYQLLVIGWSLGADPDAYSIFHTDATGMLNLGFYSNEEIDDLLIKGRTTVDIDERRGYYQEFAEILSYDLPYVFLFTRDITTAVDKKVHDITVGALGLWWFDRWYISEE